jgi:uncharacterized membrane protein
MEDIIKKTLEYLNSTEAFIQAQLPDYINQYMTWAVIDCWFYIFLFSILFLVPFITFIKVRTKISGKDFDYFGDPTNSKSWVWLISMVMSIIFGFAVIIIIPVTVNNLLKIHFAPKVYLVEKLSGMLKK